jgi:hypothetical protein
MPPETALNLPLWFIVLFIGCGAYLLAMTRARKDLDEALGPVPGLAREAVSDELERGAQLDVAGVETVDSTTRNVRITVSGCDCPYCRACGDLHAQGFTYIDGRWIAVN